MKPPAPEVDIPYATVEALAGAADLAAAKVVIASLARLCVGGVGDQGRPASDAGNDAVGPWERREDGGRVRFAKRADTPEGSWAQVEEIPAAKIGRRVVLIGESVARAHFLDPLFTCARVLQSLCTSAAGEGAVEVVDLAHDSLTPRHAVDLLKRAAVLDPDLYVVFAGNNLRRPFETGKDAIMRGCVDEKRCAMFAEAAGGLSRQRSWRAIETYSAAFLEQQVRDFVGEIAWIAREQGVPLLYVIPAFNERDWRASSSWTNPLSAASDQRLARAEIARAEQLLERGRIGDAEGIARHVLGVDQWLNPYALQLLARAALDQRMDDKARALFRRAADTVYALPVPSLRQCTPAIAAALREHGRAEGLALVDLPEVLYKAHGSTLGRELFLDHVHMSALGIQDAMVAVAEQVVALLRLQPPSRTALVQSVPQPAANAVAQSHFLAAMFNAACGQSLELVGYHTRRALDASPAILAAMELYVQRSARRAPDLLCAGHEAVRSIQAEFPAISKSIARPLGHSKPVHHELLRYWTEILRQRGVRGEPFETALGREYGVFATPIDLLDARVSDVSPFNLPRLKLTFSARDTASVFWFCWNGVSDAVRLRITTRVPAAAVGSRVTLAVNDTSAHAWPATAKWWTTECTVLAATLRSGVNLLRIDWPDPEYDDRLQRLVTFMVGNAAISPHVLSDREMYPLYGEVCLLSACVAEVPSATRSAGIVIANEDISSSGSRHAVGNTADRND